MTTSENIAPAPRQGSLMAWRAECGHMMVCYSLEPTPILCPDCVDAERKVLADMVGWDLDLEEVPSNEDGDLNEWLDECGVKTLEAL